MSSRGQQFLDTLAERVVVGDGAMGTRLYELGMSLNVSYDYLNLARPNLVEQVHREYLQAGAQLIETNTFSANRVKLGAFGLEGRLAEINTKGVELAKRVAGSDAFVAGSIGPLPTQMSMDNVQPLDEPQIREALAEQITALAEAGADLIMLETFTDLQAALWALEETKRVCDLPVIAQMTFPDGRYAPDGTDAYAALDALHRAGADVVGTNCGQGVSRVLRVVEYVGQRTEARLSAFANAGMPEQVNGRFMYLATPEYLAESAERMVHAGANLIGGCCGTTAEEIRAVADRLAGMRPAKRVLRAPPPVTVHETPAGPPAVVPEYLARLKEKSVILVELDPPKNTDLNKMLGGARLLRDAGVDAITLGDSPLAQLRMNGIMAGAIVQRELDVPVICHLACRDRNLIGTQALLMGADALGIRSILALTGDPSKVGDHPDATAVYDLNSFKLVEAISKLNKGQNMAGRSIGRPTQFHIGVAYNPNKRDVTPETKRLRRKVERGATYALTQAVFDGETMQRAWEATRDVGIPIFAGVFPLLSDRHAEFLHNEFPGITITDSVRQRMAAAAPDKQRMAEEGMKIARETIDAFRPYCDGFYLIPPLNRAPIAVELIEYIKSTDPVRA